METPVYNQQGKEIGKIILPKEIFGLDIDESLIQEVVVLQMANRRQATTHAKDRSEVRGGGRKPWRQKGTGRARHGSRRSPIWKGGGVTFGPIKDKIYKKKINKKIKRKALLMVLSAKAKNNLLTILDKIQLKEIKTKELFEFLKKLPEPDNKKKPSDNKKNNCLIILESPDKKLILSANNLPDAQVMQAKDLNAFDLLCFERLIMSQGAIEKIKENFLTEKSKN